MRRLGLASAERDRVADEARAATTQARFTGLLVVALPLGATLFAELLRPGFVGAVLSDPAAAAMLLMAGGLQLVGFLAIRLLLRYVRTRDYRPFVYYRLLFSLVVFAVLLARRGNLG